MSIIRQQDRYKLLNLLASNRFDRKIIEQYLYRYYVILADCCNRFSDRFGKAKLINQIKSHGFVFQLLLGRMLIFFAETPQASDCCLMYWAFTRLCLISVLSGFDHNKNPVVEGGSKLWSPFSCDLTLFLLIHNIEEDMDNVDTVDQCHQQFEYE